MQKRESSRERVYDTGREIDESVPLLSLSLSGGFPPFLRFPFSSSLSLSVCERVFEVYSGETGKRESGRRRQVSIMSKRLSSLQNRRERNPDGHERRWPLYVSLFSLLPTSSLPLIRRAVCSIKSPILSQSYISETLLEGKDALSIRSPRSGFSDR